MLKDLALKKKKKILVNFKNSYIVKNYYACNKKIVKQNKKKKISKPENKEYVVLFDDLNLNNIN